MRPIFFIIVVLLAILPFPSFFYQVKANSASSSDISDSFESTYQTNSLNFSQFDVQPLYLNDILYISFVEAGTVYYNYFYYSTLHVLGNFQKNSFNILSGLPDYFNSSTTISGSQYFTDVTQISVFVIYYTMGNQSNSYIFVFDASNNLKSVLSIPNISYYQTNKIVQFATSNNIYIELRNTSSFFIYSIDLNNQISKVYQSPNIPNQYFDISDIQFGSNTLFVLSNKWNYITQQNLNMSSTIYMFGFNNQQFSANQIDSNGYFNTLTIQDKDLYVGPA